MIIQHVKKEVWESRGLLQQEVIFLHQNIVETPEPQRSDTSQITWMMTYYTRVPMSSNYKIINLEIIKCFEIKCNRTSKQSPKIKLRSYLCDWNTLQSIYQTRQQRVVFYQAAPWSGRYGLKGMEGTNTHMQAWDTQQTWYTASTITMGAQCSHSVISFNPVWVLVTPVSVSTHCTEQYLPPGRGTRRLLVQTVSLQWPTQRPKWMQEKIMGWDLWPS